MHDSRDGASIVRDERKDLPSKRDGIWKLLTVFLSACVMLFWAASAFVLYWLIPGVRDRFADRGVELPPWLVLVASVSDWAVHRVWIALPLFLMTSIVSAVAVIYVCWPNRQFR